MDFTLRIPAIRMVTWSSLDLRCRRKVDHTAIISAKLDDVIDLDAHLPESCLEISAV